MLIDYLNSIKCSSLRVNDSKFIIQTPNVRFFCFYWSKYVIFWVWFKTTCCFLLDLEQNVEKSRYKTCLGSCIQGVW
jgi:hypothetical protein